MEESYLWKSGIAQYEMRLLIEGALVLYENEASFLLSLAMKHQDYEAADAFEALGCALNALQTQVRDLQKAHREERCAKSTNACKIKQMITILHSNRIFLPQFGTLS